MDSSVRVRAAEALGKFGDAHLLFTVKELRRACPGVSPDMVRCRAGVPENTSLLVQVTALAPSGRKRVLSQRKGKVRAIMIERYKLSGG